MSRRGNFSKFFGERLGRTRRLTQINLDKSLEEYTKALKEEIEISQEAGLSAGTRHVRVVAVELTGTVTMPLDRKQ